MKLKDFEFSDLIGGYVVKADKDKSTFTMKTSDGREFSVKVAENLFARGARNLGEGWNDATGKIWDLLVKDQFLYAYGVFYPQKGEFVFEAKILDFLGDAPGKYRFEEQSWWINQARSIGDFFINHEFGGPDQIDYIKYRTNLKLTGEKLPSTRQEIDTISRMVYGLASAYLMTGEQRFLEAAEKGTMHLIDNCTFMVDDKTMAFYHCIDPLPDGTYKKTVGSQFGDDWNAIPMYEQIYALAGPTQTYRITGDPKIMDAILKTMNLFERYKDNEKGGYYSHLDPLTLDPKADILAHNKARKNWNSVGDHAPAYLINLVLATGDPKHEKFLEYTFDTIEKYFPDYKNSPFVNEKFFDDWSHDQQWGWQQNRAVCGHNLKIAWNLMRMNSLKKKEKYEDLAKKIAKLMPDVGMDKQRTGWYDVVERTLRGEEEMYRFAWHDRKAWWQQEQGILAYLILNGCFGDKEYLKLARESVAFYNAFFLDHEDGDVYFNVLANGLPYLLGTERQKASHSKACYHSIELCYLSAVYSNLLVTKQPMDFFFNPKHNGFKGGILRVAPDLLPNGSIQLTAVEINGIPYGNFDKKALTIKVPDVNTELKIKATITPVGK